MARLAPESKMIGKHSAIPPGSSKRGVSIPPCDDENKAANKCSSDGS